MKRAFFTSSLREDCFEGLKWCKISFSLCAEVTFQKKLGYLNTPLSLCSPWAGDGVSLCNDKGKLTFICLHLFLLPHSLCHWRGGLLFPFIFLYYVLFGLRDLWISRLFSHCRETFGFDVSRCCICVSALCKQNKFQWEFLLQLKLKIEVKLKLREQCYKQLLLSCNSHSHDYVLSFKLHPCSYMIVFRAVIYIHTSYINMT